MEKGILNIITTPIGNYADITIRAVKSLEVCDFILCESFKDTSRLLNFFGLKKELRLLNEHNEEEAVKETILELLEGKNIGLVSDSGTPAFEDPGKLLIEECINYGINLNFIHGSNSVLTALVISGFDISRFYYIGLLSPKREIREREIISLKTIDKTFVILDTPYRLVSLLEDLEKHFTERKLFLGFNLTMDEEKQFRGTPSEILDEIKEFSNGEKIKGEFVIVVNKS